MIQIQAGGHTFEVDIVEASEKTRERREGALRFLLTLKLEVEKARRVLLALGMDAEAADAWEASKSLHAAIEKVESRGPKPAGTGS